MPTVLQNVVFPAAIDPDVLPLYLDPETWTVIDGRPTRLSDRAHVSQVRSAHSSVVPPASRVSYGTYFNGFPASYWQRWTVLSSVTLRLRTTGDGAVVVYKSNSSGNAQRVASHSLTGTTDTELELPLNTFSDGGWYWFDLVAEDAELVLEQGSWTTEQDPTTPGLLSLGMTTYNKPDYCVATLNAVAANPALLDAIDTILLVDQGTQQVRQEPGFDEVATRLGAKLRVIEQGNLGGSGGFSRAMAETLKLDDSDFLMLLDDDVELEAESVLRAHQFARFGRAPMIVGGHMFDLLDKPIMHAWAETVNQRAFNWGPSFPEQHRHDFRAANLRQTPWMHARLDADYNGWWMCLIPKTVIQDVGLSLPVFIKWDDSEYALRARAHGYRTVSLPGVALWHVSWLDKDDSQDWQSFFHTRNRIIAGLLHSTQPAGGKLLQNMGRQDLKKLLNMQYYAVQLSVDGLRSVLEGPHRLHDTIGLTMPAARAKAKDFPETHVFRAGDDAPVSRAGRALPRFDLDEQSPHGLKLALFTLRQTPEHWRKQASPEQLAAPDVEYAKRDAKWWVIPHHKSVLVGTADGSGKSWYRHDRAKFRALWKESRKLLGQIEKDWDRLSQEYRDALPEITSVSEWQRTFDGRS